ncbi:polysaccharide pyruvyl transferase family protein [Nakamurella sp. GG22]
MLDIEPRVRVLIENSEYWLRNNGDLAMLDVTIERVRERWPHARIAVLTDSPSLLRAYFPKCEAITVFDSDPWAKPRWKERLAARVGPRVVGPVALTWLRLSVSLPQKTRGAKRRLRGAWRALAGDPIPALPTPDPAPVTRGSFAAVEGASLLLSLGGGYLTDADPAQTTRVFNLCEQAYRHGIPVAMVGQGVGPIDNPDLRARAVEVLPHAQFIAVRERRRGPALLDEIGVAPERVLVTGDDAIELAYRHRPAQMGTDIGFCLRVAEYSPVSDQARYSIGSVVRDIATQLDAPLAPLIIAEYKAQDRRSTLPLVRGYPKLRRPPGRYTSPREVAVRVAQCRVIVTGAYHLAVFALSQGTPVVALTSSAYYDDKFLGLADMFGTGLQMIDLRAADLEDSLAGAIRSAWREAPGVREPLRASARDQIVASKEGFDRVFRLVEKG